VRVFTVCMCVLYSVRVSFSVWAFFFGRFYCALREIHPLGDFILHSELSHLFLGDFIFLVDCGRLFDPRFNDLMVCIFTDTLG
jgi:hypothetical protein